MRRLFLSLVPLAAVFSSGAASSVAQAAPKANPEATRQPAPLAPSRPASGQARPVPHQCPQLPRAITSFGAAASGGWVYVYGGHVGREHQHSRDHVVGDFGRLALSDGTWQALPSGPALQGTALVAAGDGSLYRVGGLSARNAPEADADLHSTASVDRFEPRTGRW